MDSDNPYSSYAESFRKLFEEGINLPLGGMAKPPVSDLLEDAPVALLFSPHPDDECIIGGLPLRLLRETGVRVVNVAVTLGSNKSRQQPRLAELKGCLRMDRIRVAGNDAQWTRANKARNP